MPVHGSRDGENPTILPKIIAIALEREGVMALGGRGLPFFRPNFVQVINEFVLRDIKLCVVTSVLVKEREPFS